MTDEQKQNLEESKEAISKVIMLMRTVAIVCRHTKSCNDCPFASGICSWDLGFPYEWDTVTLREFQKALNHAVDLTITKGDNTQ